MPGFLAGLAVFAVFVYSHDPYAARLVPRLICFTCKTGPSSRVFVQIFLGPTSQDEPTGPGHIDQLA